MEREHFVAYHSEKIMGRPFDADTSARVSFLSKKPQAFLKRSIGQAVWIISGVSTSKRTAYSLHGSFVPDEVRASVEDVGTLVIEGPVAWKPITPIPLNDLPWFETLFQEQARFSLGFNGINSPAVVDALLRLAWPGSR